MSFDPADIPLADEYVRCNFSRKLPTDIGGGVMRGTRLFPGDDTPRTFRQCNLTNCEPPPGSTVIESNTHIVDPNSFNRADIVRVNGLEVGRRNFTDNIHYGRYNPSTESYDDNPAPVVTPND